MTGGGSSLPEVQRLLAVLSAGGRAAELGTAFGEGAVAIASTAASLVTVEIDPSRAAHARERLRGLDSVELYVGDCGTSCLRELRSTSSSSTAGMRRPIRPWPP